MYGIEKIGERSVLMRRMGDALGVSVMRAVADRNLGAMDLRSAVLNCTACRHADECERWLDEQEGAVAAYAPDFCGNAELFDALTKAH